MRKMFSVMFYSLCIFMLIGCEEKADSDESIIIAKADNFDTYFYESDRYSVYLHEDIVTIKGIFINDDRKSIIDEFLLSEGLIDSPFIHKEYSNAKVEVKGDKYFVKAEGGISLEFKTFMDHIIIDSEGMEYIRKKK